jgi:hypothetical protein
MLGSRLGSVLIAVSLLASSFMGRAAAQDKPINLRIAPELALVIAQPAAPLTRDALWQEREERTQLRIGRSMRTAGISLVAAGITGMAMGMAQRKCYGGDRKANVTGIVGGAIVAGVGAGFTFGGTQRIRGVRSSLRESTSHSGWLFPLAAATFATALVSVLAASIPEEISCTSD